MDFYLLIQQKSELFICILRGCLSEFLLDDVSLSLKIAFTLANSVVPYEVPPYGNVALYGISSVSSLFAEVPVGLCLPLSRLKRVKMHCPFLLHYISMN